MHAATASRPMADPLVTALTAYRGRRSRALREDVFRHFLVHDRVERMAAKFEFELNLRGDRDEIIQSMAIVFLEKYLDTLDDPENVFTLLYSVARNTALTIKGTLLSHDSRYQGLTEPDHDNDRSRRPVEQEVALASAADIVTTAADDFTREVENEIDRTRAEAKFAERLARLDPALRARVEEQVPVAPPRPPRVRTISRDSERLLQIRDRMHYDNRKFALALGIDHPLLCAYIYGRTQKVRATVMAQAERLYRERGRIEAEHNNRLARSSMRRVVNGWLELLGQDADQPGLTALGVVLATNWHTVRRWHGNEFKPALPKLKQLDEAVQAAARKRAAKAQPRTATALQGAGRRRDAISGKGAPRAAVVGQRRPSTGRQAPGTRPAAQRAAAKAAPRRSSAPTSAKGATAGKKKAVRKAPAKAAKKAGAKAKPAAVVKKAPLAKKAPPKARGAAAKRTVKPTPARKKPAAKAPIKARKPATKRKAR